MYVHCSCLQPNQKVASDLITDGCEPQCGYWDLNSGPFGRTVSVLNCWTISPAFRSILFFADNIFFIQYILYLHFNWFFLSWILLSKCPIRPLPSPCSPIHPFLLPCPALPLHCCTEFFQDQGPLLPSSWASFDKWIVSWVMQNFSFNWRTRVSLSILNHRSVKEPTSSLNVHWLHVIPPSHLSPKC